MVGSAAAGSVVRFLFAMTDGTERQIIDYVTRSGDVGELGGLGVFLFASSSSSPNHHVLPRPLCSQIRMCSVVCIVLLLIAAFQTRPTLLRSAFPAARLSSTASKPVTLKERLAELIPKEIENVCLFDFLFCSLLRV